jgi:heterodisulfide reductase subunit A-like polyferredoxin
MESLSKEAALELMRGHEREGLCHTVWTFMTPFIGGICNCDRADCMAMRATVGHSLSVMFRAEYVAEASPDLCTGCRACTRICQFGAIGFSAARKKVEIDPKRCFGCGACRSACAQAAITLKDRRSVEAAKNLW